MNAIKNSVRLIGNVGNAPELKEFESGTGKNKTTQKMARFSMATNEQYVDRKGDRQTNTEWHNVVAWGKSAELVEKLLQKGTEVVVEGKITTRSYEKDGVKRFTTEIVMNELLVLNKKPAAQEA
jgi:single-strand DNA-binding protein